MLGIASCNSLSNKNYIDEEQIKTLFSRLGVSHGYLTSRQLIIVRALSNTGFKANCQLYEKQNKSNLWILINEFPVVIGENGFAWGEGLHKDMKPKKKEGDGHAPAGVFKLGIGFGDQNMLKQSSWPYKVISDQDIFIDDVKSSYYNSFQLKDSNIKDWDSFEEMRRLDGLYDKAIVIKHNMNPVKPSFGSAIFFHIWRSNSLFTRGCTAMSKNNMSILLKWLNQDDNPLLIQLPSNIKL